MNVTEGKFKDRQLHREGHLQKVSAEQRGYAEASACRRIAENTDIITDLQTAGLLEKILHRDNLNKAYKKVKSNKGSGGVDGMCVEELLTYLREHGRDLNRQILKGKYKPNPVRRVEIPKEEKGKFSPNYSRISGIAYENGYVRENSSKTDTLQSFPPNKGALLPWGSDNF